ncbi:MAG: flippase-like domain-containing protein, partial [Chloroflexi bacterium]|nr:flippase-like domain-containing protein [Chloroflexota bacterium]
IPQEKMLTNIAKYGNTVAASVPLILDELATTGRLHEGQKVMFLAFGQPFSVGAITAVFSLGYLFTIVSPTPLGIGVAEGAMVLTLTSLRVPIEAAVVITLAYRGFTVWLPLAYGFAMLQITGIRR